MQTLRKDKLAELLAICFAQFPYVRVDATLIECYFQLLADKGEEEVFGAIVALCREPGRKSNPTVGEVNGEIQRIRREQALIGHQKEQFERLALPCGEVNVSRRAAIVEACRPVIELMGRAASQEELFAARAEMEQKLRGVHEH